MKKFFYRSLFLLALLGTIVPMQAKANAAGVAVIIAGDGIFDNVIVGQCKTLTVEIRNTGDIDLNISGAQGPTQGGAFEVTPAFGFPFSPIPPKGSMTFTVKFCPGSDQLYQDAIIFSSNAAGIDPTTVLQGTGVKAEMLLGDKCDFGDVRIRKQSSACIVSAKNTGSAEASVTNVTPTGDIASFTVNTDILKGAYAPQETKSTPITFNPTVTGPKTIEFALATSVGALTTQKWTGTGVTAVLQQPAAPAKERVTVGGTKYIKVTLTAATGTYHRSVRVTSLTATPAVFTLMTAPGFDVAPGVPQVVEVAFKPTEAKEYTGILSVATDDDDLGLYTVNLSGRGDALGAEEVGDATVYTLGTSVPNPAMSASTINFSIAAPARTTVVLYNALGVAVKVLFDENLVEGAYTTSFDAKELASGTYFYTINSGTFTATKSVIIAR